MGVGVGKDESQMCENNTELLIRPSVEGPGSLNTGETPRQMHENWDILYMFTFNKLKSFAHAESAIHRNNLKNAMQLVRASTGACSGLHDAGLSDEHPVSVFM